MAATAESAPPPPTAEPPYRIRPITVDEYHRMLEAGILDEKEPVELLDGQLIAMPPEGPAHGDIASALLETFVVMFRDRAIVRAGNPVHLDRISEPEPDVAVVRRRKEGYRDAHPQPRDILLLVEISISSLAYDRSKKLVAYGRAGITEYWVVDVKRSRVEVFTEPHDDGYAGHRIAARGDSIAPRAFPDDAIPVESFLR